MRLAAASTLSSPMMINDVPNLNLKKIQYGSSSMNDILLLSVTSNNLISSTFAFVIFINSLPTSSRCRGINGFFLNANYRNRHVFSNGQGQSLNICEVGHDDLSHGTASKMFDVQLGVGMRTLNCHVYSSSLA